MLLLKIYIAIAVFAIVFLIISCGGNENSNPNQGQDIKNGTKAGNMLKGDPVEGKKFFAQTCSACHGMDAKGLPKLGKDLTTSDFVEQKTDSELLDFLKQGRLAADPLNTTGVAMPPKGGNPALNEQQLADIISYLREIHL